MPTVTKSTKNQKLTIELDPSEVADTCVRSFAWALLKAKKPELFDGLNLQFGHGEYDEEKKKFVVTFAGNLPPSPRNGDG